MNARIVVAAMLVMAGTVHGRQKESGPMESVTVCMGTPVAAARAAQAITSEIFERIAVRIDWRNSDNCPANGIAITFRMDTDPELMPGTLAYAMPFQGVTICVFYDRIRTFGERIGNFGYMIETGLLGHVLAHEIGHILEGLSRHAEAGVMKAK